MNSSSQRGARMKEERKRLGLSQQAMAEAVGISREMWLRYESGAEPGADPLAKAAERGVDVYYVLTGSRAAGSTVLTARESALVENYRAAPEDAKQVLEKTSTYLAQSPGALKKAG